LPSERAGNVRIQYAQPVATQQPRVATFQAWTRLRDAAVDPEVPAVKLRSSISVLPRLLLALLQLVVVAAAVGSAASAMDHQCRKAITS
jgi:hypothetical protein